MKHADKVKRLATLYTDADIQYTLNGESDEDFESLVSARNELHAAIDEMQAEVARLKDEVEGVRGALNLLHAHFPTKSLLDVVALAVKLTTKD